LANLSLVAATPDRFAAYRDRRLAEVSPATVRKEMALLRHVFQTALQEWNLPLAANPLADLKAPPPGKARTRRLGADEAVRLDTSIERVRSPSMRALLRFALETGMRRGELITCRWRDLNRAKRTLLISATKTDTPRTIPLSGPALAILEELTAEPEALIFPVSANAIRLMWERVRSRACLSNLRFHDLRHEAIKAH
jgi:integrase